MNKRHVCTKLSDIDIARRRDGPASCCFGVQWLGEHFIPGSARTAAADARGRRRGMREHGLVRPWRSARGVE